ncbi:RagB/SusD family nutrient uptake outer membrane protein [Chitinophaga sp.]|uniref:RagB/SusD family nutrient uptake outer membrane protein n=1 Tax=Chitinophaga sp. TaxID=1869181 RepID=UPI00261F9F05|nr:RagB/SusD family nutrient uptake outer membrane protein [uncultured Chitinophaga sp.]
MKRIFLSISAILLITATGCRKDFLNRAPQDAISDETFWQNEEQLQLALNALYANVKNVNTVAMDQMGDNSINSSTGDTYRIFSSGNFDTDLAAVNNEWVSQYSGVRDCNVFLKNYTRAKGVPEANLNQMVGEAKVIRAYMYMNLVMYFGDLPLITEPLNITELYGPRNPKKQVVDFILSELEEAAGLMQPAIMTGPKLGRISRGGALALKARMAIYDDRFEVAEDAAKRVMDMNVYQLYSTGKPAEDYYNFFTWKGKLALGANKETIIARINLLDNSMHNLSRESQVPDQASRYNPTKSLVDAYLCSDGLPITQSPLYKEDTYGNIFENRDPRMKMTILAPGSKWGGRRDGNPDNTDQTTFTAPKFLADKQGCVTITGFYYTKYVEIPAVAAVTRDANDIHVLRYAEVLLTWAEARFEQGKLTQGDLDVSINKLRERVGMMPLTFAHVAANGLDMRTEIRRERRIELAREGGRWYDMVRWKEGAKLALDVLGMKKSLALVPSHVANFKTNAEGYIIVMSGRQFVEPKHYRFPVPLLQTQRNPNLLPQNPGWE